MQIITTFFNNEQYYKNNFIIWYKKIWNANNFIFFIGRPSLNTFNFNYQNKLNFLVTTQDNITTYEYISETNNKGQWHLLKTIFFDIILHHHNIFPSLWVDCDEFIYCKNINKVIDNKRFQTHFYEYIPIKPFNFYENTRWSIWPWYYRRQSLNEIPHHDECKYFLLEPFSMQYGGHMGNQNNYCNTNLKINDYENICFHIGVYSKEHYLNSKHWLQTHPNGIEITNNDRQSGLLLEMFTKYYENCNYETFDLNLAKLFNL